MPDPIMLIGTWPGASTANTACITLAIALIGAQFVSPRTRMPTSIRMSERNTETKESQSGKPSEIFCTAASTMAEAIAPHTTHLMGKSPPASTSLEARPWNVFAITFHLSARAASPPATIRPVAGHMIQRWRTALNVSEGTRPARSSGSGATIQASTMPSPIESVTRRPISMPAPRERTPISVPTRSASACGVMKVKFKVSGIQPSAWRRTVKAAETNPPMARAATRGFACRGPSSSTSSVSPAAVPSAKVRFSWSM